MNDTDMKIWFNAGINEGWIEPYERELIRFLESKYGKLNGQELSVAVFASLFLKAGHVCLPLGRSPAEWATELDPEGDSHDELSGSAIDENSIGSSAIIGRKEEEKPFVLENGRVSFRRFYRYEKEIADWIASRSGSAGFAVTDYPVSFFESLFEGTTESPDWQQVAVVLSLIKPFLIISGGPGTGKTTTVAKILGMHLMSTEKPLRIALAAPTGKAAGRMAESLNNEIEKLNLPEEKLARLPREAGTLHRLLYRLDSGGLLPEVERKKLRYDLIVVDEASMIDLTLMYRLISHTGNNTRLILLGDKDQLASVEAGSVFADLCRKKSNGFSKETVKQVQPLIPGLALPVKKQPVLNDTVLYLTKSYRFDAESGIGRLASLVKAGKATAAEVTGVLGESDRLSHEKFDFSRESLEGLAGRLAEQVREVQGMDNAAELLDFWKQTAWLTVLRRGPEGSRELNRLVEKILVLQRTVQPEEGWYHGRPVIITRNNYSLGVFNGDLGVCVRDGDGTLRVVVKAGSEMRMLQPNRLTDCSPAYFLTVHKSQGSEFDRVNLLLPRRDTPVLSRELLYTAVTRARHSFSLHGEAELFAKGLRRNTVRYTGLKELV